MAIHLFFPVITSYSLVTSENSLSAFVFGCMRVSEVWNDNNEHNDSFQLPEIWDKMDAINYWS
jgi:hypothetical protein